VELVTTLVPTQGSVWKGLLDLHRVPCYQKVEHLAIDYLGWHPLFCPLLLTWAISGTESWMRIFTTVPPGAFDVFHPVHGV